MNRERRIAAPRWSLGSALVPDWAFWSVIGVIAVILGLTIAYLGSPKGATSLEVGALSAREQPDAPSAEDSSGLAPDDSLAMTERDPLAPFGGVEVQVLDATSTGGAAQPTADRLVREGFQIADVEVASRVYQRTTVFWTRGGGRAPAEALATQFGWRAAPKPDNLTDAIPVHVVVGEDES